MADQNDLNKPDLLSNYSSEVLVTIRAHIVRLWSGDYTGMSNLVTGMRRWINLGSGNVKLVSRNADNTETTLFDSREVIAKDIIDGAVGTTKIADGAVTPNKLSDETKSLIGSVPQNSKSASYTLVASDSGKHVAITSGGITAPSGVFSAGSAVTIYNNSSSSQLITQGSSLTLRLAGTQDSGARTILPYGLATILYVSPSIAVISGAGLE